MSHFTNIQTCFQNLFYLEKALDKLEIPNFKTNELTNGKSLILPQGENKNISFNWDGEAFALNVDADYWNQKYSVNHFLARITQEYATEAIVGESQKQGFKPVEIKQNEDGSRTISLQRWNQK
jgi:hypothetical protein|uniref:Uncharacterized protein ycf35 n=1 Tax=Ulnaria acus TaxID=1436140 RepID=H2EUZ0_9STRA|nr:ycf35 gene product [Ulnaria acus]AEX37880.1 Ycf35 [Ulnaria acus]